MNKVVAATGVPIIPLKFLTRRALDLLWRQGKSEPWRTSRSALVLCLLILSTRTGALAESFTPPIFRSNSSQFIFLKPVNSAPNTATLSLDGTITDLTHFRGKVVVLNFWATWCLPCTYEMPSLDRLAAAADPNRLAVIAVSIDRDGAAVVAPFIESRRLTHLAISLDPEQRLGSLSKDHVAAGALPLWGLPISYIIDKQGRVIGYFTGAAKWDSPQARSFLDYFMNLKLKVPPSALYGRRAQDDIWSAWWQQHPRYVPEHAVLWHSAKSLRRHVERGVEFV